MMLNILIFFVASPGHFNAESSSFESQQYFKKMKDRGKLVKIKIQA